MFGKPYFGRKGEEMSRNYKKTLSDMLLLAIILLISSVSIKIGAIVIGMIGLMELLTE
ncbi:hypothetical protein HMPREF9514_02201 [Enterococcus faecalis TX0855]|nr:hypothetical protein HMPREF9377_01029 [Enterococcus faecalis R712]EFE19846.1 hypothetical protein HMPREF9376_01121 [Enterococcus faecalis S613]EFM78985.1 hypothetical protein HMPREF9514_02201 [Enterococcus faecalis TX0855]EFQ09570.1 hypothetical protein HMPREF9492_01576 [Enterococcus faecalis DAPTO 512]EFQ68391.1 hypothetical protein HMPREF9493_00948 [Enterococcus faecalis DAPTO 516]EPH76353.1 hypothetical protein D926_01359 [Enterococcus faecalis D811610-10]EPH76455.1 hypothetical protein